MKPLQLLGLLVIAILGANAFYIPDISSLVKRKGGGGRGGGSSSSSGGKTGGSSSSSSGGSTGGTRSGVSPTYGGGAYYGGGATSAYRSGGRTPRGLLPIGIIGLASIPFFAGAWLYPVYAYPYSRPYSFYNQTADQNQTKDVLCLCQQYSDCGCEDNENSTFLNGIIGDGSVNSLNQSLIRSTRVNGTDTLVLNGTLPNGTAEDAQSSAVKIGMGQTWVWGWLLISAVTFMVL